jgi:hypothetical protein
MTTPAFFRWSLLLPVVVPLVMMPFAMGAGPEGLQNVGTFLLGSLAFGVSRTPGSRSPWP